MIYLAMLVACSLLVQDAAQQNPIKSHGAKEYKKGFDEEYCKSFCPCPYPLQKAPEITITDAGELSRLNGKFLDGYQKRSDETSPLEVEAVYSIWRDGDNSYMRNTFK